MRSSVCSIPFAEVPVSDHVIRYALSLVRQTRVGGSGTPGIVDEMAAWGAGPRAVQFLIHRRQSPRTNAWSQRKFPRTTLQALAKPVSCGIAWL